ncbi:FeoB-associated Cys-rich membrane protein [Parabacteroides sp. OttesenSCG-928-N08]|nr:FeoB-associated Cys-rich membrane protein [Parabacteroides sp. OttesenSCG-928-N08]
MWQTIAIILIGVAVVFYLGRKIYRLLTQPESVNPCEGCPGCALKELKGRDKNDCRS